ncbi:hypothetical protein BDF20DRAFT_889527 [Mycotypha africana]|uniref:uncharacterized protein n=1 Tax=Mycotypha africana TaxID=64632 RepID=UPI002301D81E|nr:uncharacterized protein BDF20DRAFT_889527 [Mycotypha africana]KAI8970135.1 hypothetical protein BDF20DRAFT_889527 [Mycotypha africana]
MKGLFKGKSVLTGAYNSVWDMYEEDIEEFQKEREDLRNRFIEAGEPIPEELQKSSNNMNEGETDIDPTMRAFLEMEKKLNNKN